MSEPLKPNTGGTGPIVERIVEGGDGPSDHPTAMVRSNAGILLAALAALFFCLKEMEGLFVLAIVIILLLALFNLWTLLRWRRNWPRARQVGSGTRSV
jgi:hypothetical protein